MSSDMVEFEYVRTVTLLGIRFWDAVLDKPVSDNLLVNAYPGNGYGSPIKAFRTASGIYGFQGLPGMQDIEFAEVKKSDGGGAVSSPPDKKSFIIEVKDKLSRFLPVVFTVELPLSYDGVYLSGEFESLSISGGGEGSPPMENPPGFYLFSAPTRVVSPGLAVIHTTLTDQTTGKPAAYAVMEVEVQENSETSKWYGIANEKGNVAILFPYPSLNISPGGSPPGSGGAAIPLDQQKWQLTFQVRYNPGELAYPPGRTNVQIPYLESILEQPAGVIWTKKTGHTVSQGSGMLTYGQELILKTEGSDESELLIDIKQAGASPP